MYTYTSVLPASTHLHIVKYTLSSGIPITPLYMPCNLMMLKNESLIAVPMLTPTHLSTPTL